MEWTFKKYKDFKRIHIEVKYMYQKKLNLEERIKLKNYIYSLNMSRGKKDRIWEYLNDDVPEKLLMLLK